MINRHRPHRKIKKDYQLKNSPNPFFHQNRKGKRRSWFKWLFLIVVFVAVFLIIFFLSFACWHLDTLKIEGLARTNQAEIEKVIWEHTAMRRFWFFRQSNIFLFDKETVAEKIKTDFNLSAVAIKKKIPRTLEIKISERPYAFIFQEGSSFFHASADAYIIKEPAVATDELKKYPILENKNSDTLIDATDQLRISGSYLSFFLTLANRLAASVNELTPEKFIIDQEFNMLTVKFIAGPAVYFNIRGDAADQVEHLLLVKKEKIKDNFSKTNYIDLRYGDRIFINPDFTK